MPSQSARTASALRVVMGILAILAVAACVKLGLLVYHAHLRLEVQSQLSQINVKFYRDNFEDFCWLRVHRCEDFHRACDILERHDLSLLDQIDAVYFTPEPITGAEFVRLKEFARLSFIDCAFGDSSTPTPVLPEITNLTLLGAATPALVTAVPGLTHLTIDAGSTSEDLKLFVGSKKLMQVSFLRQLTAEDVRVLLSFHQITYVGLQGAAVDSDKAHKKALAEVFNLGLNGKWSRPLRNASTDVSK